MSTGRRTTGQWNQHGITWHCSCSESSLYHRSAELPGNKLAETITSSMINKKKLLTYVFLVVGESVAAGRFPNIEPSSGSTVEGCLYIIPEQRMSTLNAAMACPKVKSSCKLSFFFFFYNLWSTSSRTCGLSEYNVFVLFIPSKNVFYSSSILHSLNFFSLLHKNKKLICSIGPIPF